MEIFYALLALWEGNPLVAGGFQLQRRGALMFSLICAWTNSWANNRDAGDLRCHCTHHNITVIKIKSTSRSILKLELMSLKLIWAWMKFHFFLFPVSNLLYIWWNFMHVSLYFTGDNFTLVQVISSCLQATSHSLLEPMLTKIHDLTWCHWAQTSNISHTLVGNKIIDHSDVVGAVPTSWSITCLSCSNYILILDLTPGFNGLGKDNCKARWEKCKFWDLVSLILENLW